MNDIDALFPTRQSLLSRLKDWNDQKSWKVFFDTYWRLIYSAAVKAGLTDAEAQDVVQETVISVLKNMPDFNYNSQKGHFKNWLLRLTHWRIQDQLRKRQQDMEMMPDEPDTSTEAAVMSHTADVVELEATWDEEWKNNLLEAAIERVKNKVDPGQYQIFDLHVFKNWPVLKIAQTLRINPAKVYLTKHRVGNLIKKEISSLKAKPI